jgi:hypothetical protein
MGAAAARHAGRLSAPARGLPRARSLQRIARMLDAAAPAVAGLSRRLAAAPALANLATVSREQLGDGYCGGQIAQSMRRVAGD